MIPLSDDSAMQWGEHKDKRLGDVPPAYLMWLWEQRWLREYRQLYAYIEARLPKIREAVAQQDATKGVADSAGGPLETYEDYLKHYRGF